MKFAAYMAVSFITFFLFFGSVFITVYMVVLYSRRTKKSAEYPVTQAKIINRRSQIQVSKILIISVLYCRRGRIMLMFIYIRNISLRKQSSLRNNTTSAIYLQVEMGSLTDILPVS